MNATIGTLKRSSDEPAVEVRSARELDELLDQLASACAAEFPSVVRLSVHGYDVEIGLGLPESFVHLEHESGLPPYFTTVGDPQAEGAVSFYLFGNAHTEVLRRNLIPAAQARLVVREFFDTHSRSSQVEWEKEK